jgi:hypothetical protein
MDYVLRQGETFIRWWQPQGGRWHHADAYEGREWLRKLIAAPPRGPKPNHRHFTVHNYGNGRFVYRPDLTAGSSDFADGVYDARNVRPAGEGLTLAAPGEGYATFEFRSPCVIVPVVGRTDTAADDREASVVKVDAAGASLSLSLDNGLTWQELEAQSWPAALDLTRQVAGRYGYLLKIALRGKPHEALVRSLEVTTWVQVAPAALPALRRGTNRMEYRTGDDHGLRSRVVEIRSNASNPGEFLKYLSEPPADYDPARTTSRVHGAFVARVDAPPGARIAWFSAGCSFRTHLHAGARKTRNTMAYAVNEAAGFKEIYRAEVPDDTEHWHYNADREVVLERPARTVFVRYVGDPAVNNIRLYAHCVDDSPRPASPVVITHAWLERGVRRHKRVALERPGEYDVVVEGDPVDESIEIRVPSQTD